jgi:hypothetical protein
MKALKTITLFIITIALSAIAAYVGYNQGFKNSLFAARKNPPKSEIVNKVRNGSNFKFGIYWEVWDMVTNDFLFRPVDPQKMMEGSIKGIEDYKKYLEAQALSNEEKIIDEVMESSESSESTAAIDNGGSSE